MIPSYQGDCLVCGHVMSSHGPDGCAQCPQGPCPFTAPRPDPRSSEVLLDALRATMVQLEQRGAELKVAEDRAEVLAVALRTIADMACFDHGDDEHDNECGVAVARAALSCLPAIWGDGVPCALCGEPALGVAFAGNRRLCHANERSCYNRWTIDGARPTSGGPP